MRELKGEQWVTSPHKRAVDIMAATTFLIPAAPLIGGAAFLIKMVDQVNPHFTQLRYGGLSDGFLIHKLRTMPGVSEDTTSSGPRDERASKLGLFLRRTHIDELPQLVNVLKGEMSMVGPRPIVGVAIEEIMDNLTPLEQVDWKRARGVAKRGGLVDPHAASRYTADQHTSPRERGLADIQYVMEDASYGWDLQLMLDGVNLMSSGLAEQPTTVQD